MCTNTLAGPLKTERECVPAAKKSKGYVLRIHNTRDVCVRFSEEGGGRHGGHVNSGLRVFVRQLITRLIRFLLLLLA